MNKPRITEKIYDAVSLYDNFAGETIIQIKMDPVEFFGELERIDAEVQSLKNDVRAVFSTQPYAEDIVRDLLLGKISPVAAVKLIDEIACGGRDA